MPCQTSEQAFEESARGSRSLKQEMPRRTILRWKVEGFTSKRQPTRTESGFASRRNPRSMCVDSSSNVDSAGRRLQARGSGSSTHPDAKQQDASLNICDQLTREKAPSRSV